MIDMMKIFNIVKFGEAHQIREPGWRVKNNVTNSRGWALRRHFRACAARKP